MADRELKLWSIRTILETSKTAGIEIEKTHKNNTAVDRVFSLVCGCLVVAGVTQEEIKESLELKKEDYDDREMMRKIKSRVEAC